MRQAIVATALVAVALGHTACFSYQEEIRIEEDGSGEATVDIFLATGELPGGQTLDEQTLRALIGEALDDVQVSIGKRGVRATATYRFPAPLPPAKDLGAEPFPSPHKLRWERKRYGWHHYSRNVPAGAATGGMAFPALPDMGGMPATVPGFRFRSVVHFPGEVGESNADAVEGGRATWDLSLGEVLEGKRMVADVRTGFDWRKWGTIALASACTMAFVLGSVGVVAAIVWKVRPQPLG